MLHATGTPWECCARSALKRVLATAQQEHGLNFRIGYESEFVLLRPPGDDGVLRGINKAVYSQTSALNAAAPCKLP